MTRLRVRIYNFYLLAVMLIFVVIRLLGSNTANRLFGTR
jgi:hypothetical protein